MVRFIRGIETTLPIYYPFRLGLHLSVFSFILIVPLLYFKIFMFRRTQDTSFKGKKQAPIFCSIFPLLQGFLRKTEELERRKTLCLRP